MAARRLARFPRFAAVKDARTGALAVLEGLPTGVVGVLVNGSIRALTSEYPLIACQHLALFGVVPCPQCAPAKII